MANTNPVSYYRIFLLAVWQERNAEPVRGHEWRFRLEDPHSGEQRGFASAEELVAALQSGLDRRSGNPAEFGDAEKGE